MANFERGTTALPKLDNQKLSSLIDAVDNLIADARSVQHGGDDSDEAQLRQAYSNWYAEAMKFVPSEDMARFKDMHDGGMVITRISGFLRNPRAESPVKSSSQAEGSGGLQFSAFANPVEKSFVENIRRQQEILTLVKSTQSANSHQESVDYVAGHLQNLGALVRSLESRYNQRSPYLVQDEYDLQDLVTGVLRLFDEDTEAEDFAPKMAGAGSRLDWIMRSLEIAVEAKFCRKRDGKQKVRNELFSDLATFERHPKARAFIAVVYDPEQSIDNPLGFVKDLEEHGNKLMPTRILIIPKR